MKLGASLGLSRTRAGQYGRRRRRSSARPGKRTNLGGSPHG